MATVAVVKGYEVPVGVVDLRDGWVERLVEKPVLDIFVGIGILALKGCGGPVHAYLTDAFWYDVGSTERYEKLDDDTVEEHLGYLLAPQV